MPVKQTYSYLTALDKKYIGSVSTSRANGNYQDIIGCIRVSTVMERGVVCCAGKRFRGNDGSFTQSSRSMCALLYNSYFRSGYAL
jgi:hypothetical protein